MERGRNERGAVLLTVLMLVAVIAVMAGAALEKLRLSTRLAGNAASGEQARGYAMAAEALALSKVANLLGQRPSRVTLAGGWSDRPFGLPLPGGLAVARVTDGGNCFNLNGLVTSAAPGVYVASPAQRDRFARLMTLLAVAPQIAQQIAAGASDWIDTDQDQQPSGAEDGQYLSRDPAYRTAGTLMADPSELRAIDGMTPTIYATIRPWLCTLPVAKPAIVNVNTLTPEQAPLVAMLARNLSVEAARGLLLQRPPEGYGDVSIFWRGASLQGSDVADGPSQSGIVSTWFKLRVDVTLGTTQVEDHALIDATKLPARLVSRQWGEVS